MVAMDTLGRAPVRRTSGWSYGHQDTTMKFGLACGSFLCIICLYMKLPGGPDGPDPPDGAGAGAIGQGGGASIGSSSGGQDEAIDTPSMSVGRLGAKNVCFISRF